MRIVSGRAWDDGSQLNDAEISLALQALYAAPEEESYWSSLEERIMDRLRRAEQQGEWWGAFAEWRAAGLMAAGLMLSLAGAALWKDYQRHTDIRKMAAGAAYWTVFDGASDDISIAFSAPDAPRSQAAADRLIFTSEP